MSVWIVWASKDEEIIVNKHFIILQGMRVMLFFLLHSIPAALCPRFCGTAFQFHDVYLHNKITEFSPLPKTIFLIFTGLIPIFDLINERTISLWFWKTWLWNAIAWYLLALVHHWFDGRLVASHLEKFIIVSLNTTFHKARGISHEFVHLFLKASYLVQACNSILIFILNLISCVT